MVTASVGFLILQTSAQVTVTKYFKDVYLWFTASDIIFSVNYVSGGATQFLNEVPMADYLDT